MADLLTIPPPRTPYVPPADTTFANPGAGVQTVAPTRTAEQVSFVASIKSDHAEQTAAQLTNLQQPLPQLATPQVELNFKNIVEVQAFIQQTLNTAAENNMRFEQSLSQSVSTDHIAALAEANQQIELLRKNFNEARDDLRTKTDALQTSAGQLEVANDALHNAQTALDQEKANSEQLTSADVATSPPIRSRQQDLQQAIAVQQTAQTNYDLASAAALQSEDAAMQAQSALGAAATQALQLSAGDLTAQLTADTDQGIQAEMADLMILLAELTQVINDSERSKLQNSNTLNQEIQQQRLKECAEAIKIYHEQVAAAQEKNRKSTLANQILGGFLTLIGAAASIFTGPVGIAIAAVGVAMFAVDTGLQASGKETLTSRIMTPIQEHVLGPITHFIAREIIQKAAKSDGKDISDADADLAANVMVGVGTTAIMIAAAVAFHNFGSTAGISTKIATSVTEALKRAAISPVALKVCIQSTAGVVALLRSSLQTGLGIEAAKLEQGGAESMADFEFLQNMIKIMTAIESNATQEFCNNDCITKMWEGMSDLISSTNFSARRIAG